MTSPTMTQLPTMIRVSGVSMTYPAKTGPVQALRQVDLKVGAGEWVSVIGRSGCGKSTLLHLIAGLDRPDAGRLEVDGSRADLLGRSAFMPQGDSLFEWRTVTDNVAMPLVIAGASKAEARSRAGQLLERVGLGSSARHWPRQLSGGMRQRAALVRTLAAAGVHPQPVILLDEPLGALDGITRAEVQIWVSSLVEERRATVVLVTHDVAEAVILSDRVVVMGGAPGQVASEIPVDLPRPRTAETADSVRFGELAAEVRHALRVASEVSGDR